MAFILDDWTLLFANAPWTPRRLMRCVSVGDYIYMTGGNTELAGTRVAEVWRFSIDDGWELLTDTPGWVARAAHGFVYFGGRFWIFGGSTAVGFLNDIWSSLDCITWVNEGNAAWSTRHEFGYCLHDNGHIYISGGYRTPTGHLTDVWDTADMVNWNNTAVTIGLGHREHVLISFLGDLYAYIGDNGGVSRRYIYRSINDGVNWVYLGNAAYGVRREHCGIIDDDGLNLAIVGGYNTGAGTSYNDVWETANGTLFTNIAQINSYTERSDFGFVHHKRRLYIIGGTPDTGVTFLNDVWVSPIEPFADFIGTPRTVYLGDTVTFTNLSAGDPAGGRPIVATMWNFGYTSPYGNTYALMPGTEGVSHRFLATGTFTISISVLLLDSTLLYETKIGYITVLPKTLNFTGVPRSGPAALSVSFTPEMQ